MQVTSEILIFILGVVFSVVGWLLVNKDKQQQKELTTQWARIDDLGKTLQEFRLHIAGRHYEKSELDSRFDRLEQSFRSGFNEISSKMDRLTQTVREKT